MFVSEIKTKFSYSSKFKKYYFAQWMACQQCDQIWPKFAILAKLSKSLAILWGCYFELGKILNLFMQTFMTLDKFSLQIPKR